MAGEDVTDYLYPLDITGNAITNKVEDERHTLNPPPSPEENNGEINFHFILPFAAPFYRDSVKLRHVASNRILIRGVDFAVGHKYIEASFETEGARGGIYASIMFMDPALSGQVVFDEYQTLGGNWTLDENKIFEIMSNRAVDPRTLSYEDVSGKPEQFPTLPHNHDINDMTGAAELVAAIYAVSAAVRERTQIWLDNPPHLPGDLTPELIAQYNVGIQQQFLNYYTKLQTDNKLDNLDTVLRQLIADIQNGTGTALDDYLKKDAAQLLYVLKDDMANFATKQFVNDYTYSAEEIDQMFATLNSDLQAVVEGIINLAMNQYVVDYCTTTNIALQDLPTVDGVLLTARKTVLAAFQTDARQNGMYIADAGAWRRVDYPIIEALLVKVRAGGAVFGGTQWDLTTKGAITVGTTALNFKRVGNMGKRDLFVSTSAPVAGTGVIGDVWFQI